MSRFGPYTAYRTLKDGRHTFFQMFHANLRPKGFPPTFKLYTQPTAGPLTMEERDLILERAMVNYREFCAAREAANPIKPPPQEGPVQNTWRYLADQLENSFWYEELSEHSQRLYRTEYAKVAAAFDGRPELEPGVITQSQIEQWLRRRGYSSHTIITWGVIFNHLLARAEAEGLRPNHRPIKFKVKRAPAGPIRVWEQADVDMVVQVFEDKEDLVTADLIRVAFVTGARLGDIRQLRYDVNYSEGMLFFLTNKTAAPIRLALPEVLARRLDERRRPKQLMFPSPRGRPFTMSHLSEYFRESTAHIQPEVPLKLRTLRHSAVLNFARAGCTIPMIASVTGHALQTVHTILERYLPRDPVLAAQALALRAHAGEQSPTFVVEGAARQLINSTVLPQKPTAGPQERCA